MTMFPRNHHPHACAFAMDVLRVADYEPCSKLEYMGVDARYCICGGRSSAIGSSWSRKHAIPHSYGPLDTFAEPDSESVCGACAFFAAGITFHAIVRTREIDVKLWPQASWRSYSHLFSARDGHVVAWKKDWRAFLEMPPEPPFLAITTLTGKKNLIYRGVVSHSRDLFPVLVEEDVTWVDRVMFGQVLRDFEVAYANGFSKDSILNGDYNQAAILALGIAKWRALEAPLAAHRAQRLPLMRLAHFVATRPQTSTSNM